MPGSDIFTRMRGYLLALILLSSGQIAFATDLFTDMDVKTPKVRMQAPTFALPDLNGHEIKLSDFKGKVVLLNFWATWCTPCREEMPGMQTLWERSREKGFVILAVAADRGSKKQVADFAQELTLTFPILLDPDGKVRNRYEVEMLPMSYLIGRDGRISGRVIGSKAWASQEAFALIEHLLHQDDANISE